MRYVVKFMFVRSMCGQLTHSMQHKAKTPERGGGEEGHVAEWLCSGLQIRVRRFDSGLALTVHRGGGVACSCNTKIKPFARGVSS